MSVGGAKDANQLALSCKCADSLGRQECSLLAFAACSRFLPHDGRKKKTREEESKFDFSRVNNNGVAVRRHFHNVCASCARAKHASPLCSLESRLRHWTALHVTGRREKNPEVNKPANGLRRGFQQLLSVEQFVNYLLVVIITFGRLAVAFTDQTTWRRTHTAETVQRSRELNVCYVRVSRGGGHNIYFF